MIIQYWFIGLILILILSLIFNEIIEINFWGLSKNLKRNIIKRAESESLNIFESDIVDENSENDGALIEMKNDEIYN